MTTQALSLALSHAAFGAVTMMFIAYSTVVALKVDERDVDRERKFAKRLHKAKLVGIPEPIFYVYTDAGGLSRKLHHASIILAVMYAILLGLSLLMIEPKWLSTLAPSWSSSSIAQGLAETVRRHGFSPHDPAILYTIVVVVLSWRVKWRCDLFFAAGRMDRNGWGRQ